MDDDRPTTPQDTPGPEAGREEPAAERADVALTDERFETFNLSPPEVPERSFAGVSAFLLGAVVVAAAIYWKDQEVTTSHFLLLSMILFATGAVGVLLRRNAIVLFMCIELMLNAVNLAFVAFARMHGSMEGQVVVLFVMIVAAAEVAVGLAIIVAIFMRRMTADVDELNELRG